MGTNKVRELNDPAWVKTFLVDLFRTAVDAADPHLCLPAFLPEPPKGKTVVIGAGKASAKMAQALEQHWKGDLSGVVVTRYDHAVPTRYPMKPAWLQHNKSKTVSQTCQKTIWLFV